MIYYGDVNGVPTMLAPTSGQLHAGLMFRVGRADEILSRSGVTHLLEHLALHRLGGQAEYHYNGATGAVVTFFHSQGTPHEVAAFLNGVCDALADLPLDRLELEKEILRAEDAGRSPSVCDPLAIWRYGAQGHGLLGYSELGLTMLEPDDLRRWAAYYFTRENAALWIAGDDVPPGVHLRLPAGARRPVPAASSALPKTPAFFMNNPRVIAVDAVVRRSVAANVFSQVLQRRLFQALRQEGGYSYAVNCSYDPRGDEFSMITATADSVPEMQGAALGEFLDVLAALRVGRITEADVTAAANKLLQGLDQPDVDAARLPMAAFDLLTGHRTPSLDEVRAELRAVTVQDVHQVAWEFMDTALLMTPDGHRADWAGFVSAPTTSDDAVAGRRIAPRADTGPELIIAPDGVSIADSSAALTVRYASAVALLQWPDGGRALVGPDAIRVALEPTMHHLDEQTLARVDSAVPVMRHVRMPARDAAAIPSPAPAASPTADRPGTRRPAGDRGRGERAAAALLGFVASALTVLATLITIGAWRNDRDEAIEWVTVGVVWVLALLFYLPARLLRRRTPAAE